MASKAPDLTEFNAWLIEKGKSPSTAKVYASNVRIILRDVGDGDWMNPHFVEGFFAVLQKEQPGVYGARLSGYNAWADYNAEVLGRPIARPPTKRANNEEAPDLPDKVCEAVRVLRHQCSISYQRMSFMTWEDVEFLPGARGDFYHVRDPTTKGVVFKADADAIDVLMEWSDPVHTGLPLVPREPGSEQPYPARGLQRQASRGQETVVERVARLRREEHAGQTGSAVNEVTAQTYTSDYLPKRLDSVEARLGLGGTNALVQGAVADSRKLRAPRERAPFSNESPRPEGAETAVGLRTADGDSTWAGPGTTKHTTREPAPDPHLAMAAEMMKNGVSPAEAAAFVHEYRLLSKNPFVASGPPSAESLSPRVLRDRLATEEVPVVEPKRIAEKPPVVLDDGDIVDPNDPHYASLAADEDDVGGRP